MTSKPELKKRPDLSIVIPAYCEEKRIGRTLDELASFLIDNKFFKGKAVEVIVVIADAPDNTMKVVRLKQKLFNAISVLEAGPKSGKGRDVQLGMLQARGKFIIFMDADLATPLHHLEQFFKACTNGNDIVIGTRNIFKHHPNFIRRMISNIGNLLFKVASRLWIEDSQCGFKMFTHYATNICFERLTITGWSFDMEILTIAKVNHLKIERIRLDDWTSVPGGTFTDTISTIAVRSVRDLFYIWLNRIKGTYKTGARERT